MQSANERSNFSSQTGSPYRNGAGNGYGDDHAEQASMPGLKAAVDYYEVLQISRNADLETIHRVYRIMAARFHPDNPTTGDAERFMLLTTAYRVLSDATRRMEHDAFLADRGVETMTAFQSRDFVDGIDGEVNRRLGVLSLLYHRRRMNPARPGLSVLDLETRMSFPREYLTFTLWYLRSKNLVTVEDNSDYGISPDGIDFVEENSSKNRIIRELLTDGHTQYAAHAERVTPVS